MDSPGGDPAGHFGRIEITQETVIDQMRRRGAVKLAAGLPASAMAFVIGLAASS